MDAEGGLRQVTGGAFPQVRVSGGVGRASMTVSRGPWQRSGCAVHKQSRCYPVEWGEIIQMKLGQELQTQVKTD